jgi:hypothetical protein
MSWRWDIRPRGILRAARPVVEWPGRRPEWEIWSGLNAFVEVPELTNLHDGGISNIGDGGTP